MTAGLSFNLNYTFSHALDDVSNGGVANQPFGIFQTAANIEYPQNPFNIRGNYGSSDYDVRNYFSAGIVYSDVSRHSGFHWGPNRVFSGWTFRVISSFVPVCRSRSSTATTPTVWQDSTTEGQFLPRP